MAIGSSGAMLVALLVRVHRYLGIATGPLMVMWCLSGAVMMYVPYPRLAEQQRLRALPPISWSGCCAFGADGAMAAAASGDFRIEMRTGRLVVRGRSGGSFDLAGGTSADGVSVAEAAMAADSFAGPSRFLGTVRDDTWTVSGVQAAERPLYRFAADDPARTEVYVSSVTGRAVQVTTARERFWNWLGAIPHWLYFASLRRHVRLWAAVVIYTSLAGSFLAATGLVLGWQRLRRRRDGFSPYTGANFWHHLSGLIFGLFALTWVASGLVSMNPWGLFEGGSAQAERQRLRGRWPEPERVASAIRALAGAQPERAVSVATAPFGGRMFFIAEAATGDRVRLDENGRPAPLTEADIAAAMSQMSEGVRAASIDLLAEGDDYFFRHETESMRLPVYRLILADTENTRYYLDPVSAEIESKVDPNASAYRWLHQGLHRWDFLPALRRGPARDVPMLAFLAGVLGVCVTGTFLGLRRLIRRSTR
jgi:uncharacterized iron-regulated membrane protein